MAIDLAQSHETGASPDAVAFVRFCYGRRPVAWPELYDEMSVVAARGLFRGWGYPELAEHGIGFALPDLPRLAALVASIVRADVGRSMNAGAGSPVADLANSRRPASVPALGSRRRGLSD